MDREPLGNDAVSPQDSKRSRRQDVAATSGLFKQNAKEHMMNLNISGHHLEMTDALQSYATSKMERIEPHFDHVLDAQVVLEVKTCRHATEATIKARGTTLHAEATNGDMYAAIDAMTDKLDRQVVRYKEKNVDRNNRAARHVDIAVE